MISHLNIKTLAVAALASVLVPAQAAHISIDDSDINTITIRASDFESGFYVNESLLTSGLHNSASLTLADGAIYSFYGSWIDLGLSGSSINRYFGIGDEVYSGVESTAFSNGFTGTPSQASISACPTARIRRRCRRTVRQQASAIRTSRPPSAPNRCPSPARWGCSALAWRSSFPGGGVPRRPSSFRVGRRLSDSMKPALVGGFLLVLDPFRLLPPRCSLRSTNRSTRCYAWFTQQEQGL
jgi:hypothetical protein